MSGNDSAVIVWCCRMTMTICDCITVGYSFLYLQIIADLPGPFSSSTKRSAHQHNSKPFICLSDYAITVVQFINICKMILFSIQHGYDNNVQELALQLDNFHNNLTNFNSRICVANQVFFHQVHLKCEYIIPANSKQAKHVV